MFYLNRRKACFACTLPAGLNQWAHTETRADKNWIFTQYIWISLVDCWKAKNHWGKKCEVLAWRKKPWGIRQRFCTLNLMPWLKTSIHCGKINIMHNISWLTALFYSYKMMHMTFQCCLVLWYYDFIKYVFFLKYYKKSTINNTIKF